MTANMPVLAVDDADGRTELRAPTVGRFLNPPAVGSYLQPGARMGTLRILRRSSELTVPDGVRGVVTEIVAEGRGVPVERGQLLLVLGTGTLTASESPAEQGAADAILDEDWPEGAIVVRAPTDGIFYRRPAPEEPSYVEEGAEVERGKVLGLVEVMKCFTQIKFPLDGAAKAKVLRVIPPDAAEVKLGQPLFVLTP